MSCKTCRNMSVALMLTGSLFIVASAQVKIKEKVNITPLSSTPATTTMSAQAPLIKWVASSFGSGSHVATTRPGVVINGSLTVTPATIPNKTALEIFLNGFKIYKQVNGCGGSAGEAVNPLPLTFPTCGSVSLSGNSWSPFFSGCLQQRMASQGHAVVSENSATITVDGDFNLVPTGVHWRAVFELTASLDPAFEATTIAVIPTQSELINAGSTRVDVEVYNGLGNLLTTCAGQDPILATASVQASGPYAYLNSGGQTGATITFPLSGGKGSFSLVLDQTKGIIPECLDDASITVSVDNATGSSQVALKCTYPKPTVSITSPQNETTFIVTSQDQPVIEMTEDHTPEEGEDFEPQISWMPASRIDTKEYFDLFEQDTTITVVVFAINEVSSARDSIKIILKKQEIFCTQVNFGSSSIRAGDTTSLSFKKILNDGTEDEFESGQLFNVSASGGGLILKDSTAASSLTAALPIYFIAPDSIEGDSVEISILAVPTNGSGGGVALAFRIGAQQMAAGGSAGDLPAAAGLECEISSVWVKKEPELAYFDVDLEQEIKFKESLVITVTAKDRDDRVFALEGNAQLTFAIEAAKTYATFIGTDRKEVQVIPVTLSDVGYGEANSGKILLSATVANPREPIKQRVKVFLQDDLSKKGEKEVTVNPGLVEILLGETKYFQARESFDQENLIIDEVPTPEIVDDGITIDVWENDPVVKKQGDKIGVYWEKQKKIYPSDKPQPPGIIRVVGRYWDSTQTYSVELKAERFYEYGSRHGILDIEVKKPSELGRTQFARNRRNTKDVFGQPLDIDDLCIKYGGQFGIPPHFIKGHIQQEAAYVGKNGVGFAPSYRFELYTAQFWITEEDWGDNPYFVAGLTMGSGKCVPSSSCPPIHQHVQFTEYPPSPKTLWDIIWDHSQLVNPDNTNSSDPTQTLYGLRASNGAMNFAPYETIQNIYNGLVSYYLNEVGLHDGSDLDSARVFLANYLENFWLGGFRNIMAQTRLASSYGLLQMMLSTATKRGYPKNDSQKRPEDLNETEKIMQLSMVYQKRLLRKALGIEKEVGGNWGDGFEKTFRDKIYAEWNTIEEYPNQVMKKAENYQPQR